LPHYLPIEGFPYHQASLIHVLTAGNIGNVFSSAGICVLVQQTDLKKINKTAAESSLFVSLGMGEGGTVVFFLKCRRQSTC
jgi:hypothetical protein